MTTNDTPTPRTDNEDEHASNVALYIDCHQTHKWSHGPMVVPSDFARQLERELRAHQRILSDIAEILDGKEDADDGQPNDAMKILSLIRSAPAAAPVA